MVVGAPKSAATADAITFSVYKDDPWDGGPQVMTTVPDDQARFPDPVTGEYPVSCFIGDYRYGGLFESILPIERSRIAVRDPGPMLTGLRGHPMSAPAMKDVRPFVSLVEPYSLSRPPAVTVAGEAFRGAASRSRPQRRQVCSRSSRSRARSRRSWLVELVPFVFVRRLLRPSAYGLSHPTRHQRGSGAPWRRLPGACRGVALGNGA